MEEANMYKSGWGNTIFQEASNLAQAQLQQEARLEAEAKAKSEMTKSDEKIDDPQESIDLQEQEKIRQQFADELIREEEAEKKRQLKKLKKPLKK